MIDVERRRDAVRHLAVAQLLGELHDADAAIGAGDGETPAGEFDVGFCRFQQMCRSRLALGDDQRGGFHDRHAARSDRTRSSGAVAGVNDVAVALFELDPVEGHAELIGQHLRERRGVALAVIECTGNELYGAVGLEHDLAEFDAGRGGDLEIGADRDAAQLAQLAAVLLALGKARVIGDLERLVEDALEIAAVVGDAGGGCERHLRRLDEVALAERQPVDAHFVGGAVDQPLHVVVGFGPAGAAIRAEQRGIGQHALDVDAEQRRAIDAGEVLAGVQRQRARRDAGDVGAEVTVAAQAHREEFAVLVERKLGVDVLRTALTVGQEAGGAFVDPLHRTTEHFRGIQDAHVFGIVDVLHPERAADIGGEDAHLLVRQLHILGEVGAIARDALGRHLDRVVIGGLVVGRQTDARLHRHHGDAGVGDVEFRDMRRALEGGIDRSRITEVIVQRHVVRDVVVELRRAGLRRFRSVGDGGQFVDVEHDGFGGVACLRQRLGDDKGHGIADIAHLVGHQRHAIGLMQWRAVAVLQWQTASEGTVVGGGKIGAGPDAEHAGHRFRRRGVDAANDAVRVARANDEGIGLPGQVEIVGVFALAADQRVVLLAADGLPDSEFLQCNSVIERGAGGVILHGQIHRKGGFLAGSAKPVFPDKAAGRGRQRMIGHAAGARWLRSRPALLNFP